MTGGKVIDGVLQLSGPLTFDTVGAHFRDSGRWFSGKAVEKVDLAKVDSVDSAGLALLLEWQSTSRQRGSGLSLLNAPRDLLRLAALAEASELLGLMPVPELAHDKLV